MATQFRVVGPDLRRVSKQLDGLAAAARKQLVVELRAAALPAAEDVRRAVRAIPSKNGSGGGDTQRRRAFVDHKGHNTVEGRAKAAKRADKLGTGLRESIARAVRVTVSPARGSVFIAVGGDLGHVQHNLPSYLEGAKRPWRHPVYGHDKWVTQPAHPYFTSKVRRHRAEFNTAASKAIHKAALAVGFR